MPDKLKPEPEETLLAVKEALSDLEDILFGTVGDDPRLPTPAEVIDLFTGGVTDVNMLALASQPTFNEGTGVLTLPSVTGVQWKVNGVNKTAGAQPAIASGASITVEATPLATYYLNGDTDFSFHRP